MLDLETDAGTTEAFVAGQAAMAKLAVETVDDALITGEFRISISYFSKLHKAGYSFIDPQAGYLRRTNVSISNAVFVPPPADGVIEYMEEMCNYINDNWRYSQAIHLAAYTMWRSLWIHPFLDGNGSIARMASFTVFQIKTNNIIDGFSDKLRYISENRSSYYDALAEADRNWTNGTLDLAHLESFMQNVMNGGPPGQQNSRT